MAIINFQEIKKMTLKDRQEKIKELKLELIKERINIGKGGKIKVKDIKRTIARLLTLNRLNKKSIKHT